MSLNLQKAQPPSRIAPLYSDKVSIYNQYVGNYYAALLSAGLPLTQAQVKLYENAFDNGIPTGNIEIDVADVQTTTKAFLGITNNTPAPDGSILNLSSAPSNSQVAQGLSGDSPPQYQSVGSIYVKDGNLLTGFNEAYGTDILNDDASIQDAPKPENSGVASNIVSLKQRSIIDPGDGLGAVQLFGQIAQSATEVENAQLTYRVDKFVLDSNPDVKAVQVFKYRSLNLAPVPLTKEQAQAIINGHY